MKRSKKYKEIPGTEIGGRDQQKRTLPEGEVNPGIVSPLAKVFGKIKRGFVAIANFLVVFVEVVIAIPICLILGIISIIILIFNLFAVFIGDIISKIKT